MKSNTQIQTNNLSKLQEVASHTQSTLSRLEQEHQDVLELIAQKNDDLSTLKVQLVEKTQQSEKLQREIEKHEARKLYEQAITKTPNPQPPNPKSQIPNPKS